jgi:hypothetical protein
VGKAVLAVYQLHLTITVLGVFTAAVVEVSSQVLEVLSVLFILAQLVASHQLVQVTYNGSIIS